MLKTICTVVGTRPEIIRLSVLIKRLDSIRGVKHILIHTGQNYDYELNQIFFDDLELRAPDYFLEAAGDTPTKTIAAILAKLEDLLTSIHTEAFLVLGDTNTALASIAAKKLHIPVFHCEAGNRSFDERVPEELNRKLVDHIADVNLPYSRHARDYLLREGIAPSRIVVTGSPMKEVLELQAAKVAKSNILKTLEIKKNDYFLVSSHREENVSNPVELQKLVDTLNGLAKDYRIPVIVSTHPRTKKELDKLGLKLDNKVRLIKPFGYSDYLRLQQDAKCVLSDSGTISEESAILGFPAVNIRYSQERPEAFEKGVLPLVGLDFESVKRGIEWVLARTMKPEIPEDYKNVDFSDRVINTLLSHIQNKA
jgi:UDP-N-acetyl-L-fucosamine synthase